MKTAGEMRDIALEAKKRKIDQYIKQDMEAIFRHIESAAINGNFSINVRFDCFKTPSDALLETLLRLGYKTTANPSLEDPYIYYKISWT